MQDAARIAGLGFVGDANASAKILTLARHLDPDRDLERVGIIVSALVTIGVNDALEAVLHGETLRGVCKSRSWPWRK